MENNCETCAFQSNAASKLNKLQLERLSGNCASVIFKKSDMPINARLQKGVYRLTIPFDVQPPQTRDDSI